MSWVRMAAVAAVASLWLGITASTVAREAGPMAATAGAVALPTTLAPTALDAGGVRPVAALPDALAQPGCPLRAGQGKVPTVPVPGVTVGPALGGGGPRGSLRLVAEDALPEPAAPPAAPRARASVAPLEGTGMWTWRWRRTEGGDAAKVVARAKAAGMSTLWVRVGDSRDGFYAAEVLEALVPRARAAGLAVVGWGFPFLHDPVADAAWTRDALAWRSAGGLGLDAFSPDLETSSEGVIVTERRVALYLQGSQEGLAGRPLVATVYPPTDHWWATYPYGTVAPYVDAWAPMLYWGCRDPGAVVEQAMRRLGPSAPVLPVGQAYDQGPEGGRSGRPTAAETLRFLEHARRRGAAGASFWLWDDAAPEQWQAIASYPWR